jgi:hypothetical protein
MDIQKFMDAISDASKETRSKYHLTLGGLIHFLSKAENHKTVRFDKDNLGYPSAFNSYRGYYSDLAFEASQDEVNVSDVLACADRAFGRVFDGYKGGDFEMGADTPLWVSEYGMVSGMAVIGIYENDGVVFLQTKEVK